MEKDEKTLLNCLPSVLSGHGAIACDFGRYKASFT